MNLIHFLELELHQGPVFIDGIVKCVGLLDDKPGPRSEIKTKYEKHFFGDLLSADFWQNLWEKIKIAMKSFSKNLSFGDDFKL